MLLEFSCSLISIRNAEARQHANRVGVIMLSGSDDAAEQAMDLL